jgi:hypothetical protein
MRASQLWPISNEINGIPLALRPHGRQRGALRGPLEQMMSY